MFASLLSILLIICFTVPTQAAGLYINEVSSESDTAYEVEVIVLDANDPDFENQLASIDLGTWHVVRNHGTLCDLRVSIATGYFINGIRYKSIAVKSLSVLFPETYETFGDGVNYTVKEVPGLILLNYSIGHFDLDESINRVTIHYNDFQVHTLGEGAGWKSVGGIPGGTDVS